MIDFTGERIVPEASNCEPNFARKMYMEHIARYTFASRFVKGKTVLDAGCGVGYGSAFLAEQGAQRVVAFDMSEQAIDHARAYYGHQNVNYIASDIYSLHFQDKFDVITCFEMIEHVPDPYKALSVLKSHLNEGGILLISTPRYVGENRSQFHHKEFSAQEFKEFISSNFQSYKFFFQNNHFTSLIAENEPKVVEIARSLTDQFNVAKADYIIACASDKNFQADVHPFVVVNDDAYIKLLEHDIDILKKANAQIEKDIAVLRSAESSYQKDIEKLRAIIEKNDKDIVLLHTIEFESKQRIASLEKDNEEYSKHVVRLKEAEKGLKEEAERLKEETGKLEEEAGRLSGLFEQEREKSALLDARLKNIFESNSWRVTAPFRDAKQLVLDVQSRYTHLKVYQEQHGTIETATKAGKKIFKSVRNIPALVRKAQTEEPPAPQGIIPDQVAQLVRTTTESRFERPMGPTTVLYIVGCLEGESKRYRVFNFIEGFSQIGIRAEAITEIEIPEYLQKRPRLSAVIFFRAADSNYTRKLLDYARENNVKTFFDVDDLVFEPENTHYVRARDQMSTAEQKFYDDGVRRYRTTLEKCDFAIVTTEFLANRIKSAGKKAFVLPNTINYSQYKLAEEILSAKIPNEGDNVIISYFSGSSTHNLDFLECEDALIKVLEKYPNVKLLLGGLIELNESKWKHFENRITRLPFMPYLELLRAQAKADINIAPLERGNPYCEGKSQLKIFEAGLVEVPTVASRVSGYGEAIENGVDGYLVSGSDEWENALTALVQDVSLRRRMGVNARKKALAKYYISSIAPGVYDVIYEYGAKSFVLSAGQKTANLKSLAISWIVPEPIIGGGGHRNIFRAAYYLQRFGHKVSLYFTSTFKPDEELAGIVNEHFYPIGKNNIHRFNGTIENSDVALATHWSTVKPLLHCRRFAKHLMYFVQDFEPLFSPMGSEYLLAENTYRLGLYHITSGPWCTHILKKRFNADADYFRFPVDREIYHAKQNENREREVIFFAKPEMTRRCFEIGIEALELFHRIMPDVKITLFGSNNVSSEMVRFRCDRRGILPGIKDLAALYSRAMVGMVFSPTNPSLVPYEMMACGLPIIDLNIDDSLFHYENSDNVMLAGPKPEDIAYQLKRLVDDSALRQKQALSALKFVNGFPSELEMAKRIEELILLRVAKV